MSHHDQPRRVQVLVGEKHGYFKPKQYGYVIGVNTRGGMYYVYENRISEEGEPAYLVAKTKHGRAGALWFSGDTLRFPRSRRK